MTTHKEELRRENQQKLLVLVIVVLGCLTLTAYRWVHQNQRTIDRIAYSTLGICRGCGEGVWQMDEERRITYTRPAGWEVVKDEDSATIQTPYGADASVSINHYPWADEENTRDPVEILELRIPALFKSATSIEITEPPELSTQFGEYPAGYASLVDEREVSFQITESQSLTDFPGGENLIPIIVTDYTLYLVNYDGEWLLFIARTGIGTEQFSPWIYEQLQIVLNSIVLH